jgi:hypothetical protein
MLKLVLVANTGKFHVVNVRVPILTALVISIIVKLGKLITLNDERELILTEGELVDAAPHIAVNKGKFNVNM